MAHVAKHRFARTSAKRIRPIAQMIQGMLVARALAALQFSPKRGSRLIEKVLRSAVANAGASADADAMVVQSVRIDEGPLQQGAKRFIPVSRGMAHPIRHRTCHIFVQIDNVSPAEEK
jgi:large subunit ribosomal protein L22